MKYLIPILTMAIFTATAQADYLCFSPVKEKEGDKNTKRSFWQSFDYKVQVDSGPIVVPFKNKSTKYEINNNNPMVKIYLGNEVIESFRFKPEWVKKGKNCIYFK